MRKKMKMEDLAALAGVSKSTVSRALSGSPLVNAKTTERIKTLSREHNYRLDFNARNFFKKETLTIAVLIPTDFDETRRLSDPFFLELLGSIADALDEKGHELVLAKTSPQSVNWIEQYIESRRSDGVILIGQGLEHDKINELSGHFGPLIVWGAALPDQQYVTVGSDNRAGGQKATAHLLKSGRRKLLFLGNVQIPEVGLRYQGYRMAHEQYGLEVDPALCIDTPFSGEAAFGIISALLETDLQFDGIVAASDVIAMTAMAAMKQKGIAVPEDVAVVGYDNVVLGSYFDPALTTISQNCEEGGRKLVEGLLAKIEGKAVESVLLPTELIVRRSSQKPAP